MSSTAVARRILSVISRVILSRAARRWGVVPIHTARNNPIEVVHAATQGRGADVVFEAAWADTTVAAAAAMARFGGRVVLVGIPSDDRLLLQHSTARRKGLTLVLSRRMKHVYPRCLTLAAAGAVELRTLVSHRFPLAQAAEAFGLNAHYRDQVRKVMITS